jgi:hypothetical protein
MVSFYCYDILFVICYLTSDIFNVFMKTLASPINAGSSIGEGSMKKAIKGTAVPLDIMPF